MAPTEQDLRDASLEAQVDRLEADMLKIYGPRALALARWLDRLLRRWPRLYAWLSR